MDTKTYQEKQARRYERTADPRPSRATSRIQLEAVDRVNPTWNLMTTPPTKRNSIPTWRAALR